MAAEVRRVCFRCGTPTDLGAVFTPTLPRGRRRPRYSHWSSTAVKDECDDCRRRAWWTPRDSDEDDDSFTVTARDAERFLALAREYAVLARAADDPEVYPPRVGGLAHRLARAARDYATIAARSRGA